MAADGKSLLKGADVFPPVPKTLIEIAFITSRLPLVSKLIHANMRLRFKIATQKVVSCLLTD